MMMEITNQEIALLAVSETERGWIRSRSGNYYLEFEDGNLSVCWRDGKGWGWNFYETDCLGTTKAFPRFQGDCNNALAAMLQSRQWYEDRQESQK